MARKKTDSKIKNVSKIAETQSQKGISELKQKSKVYEFVKSSFDFKTVLQILAITISLTAIFITVFYNTKREENEKSKISLQMGIQPSNNTPSNGQHLYFDSWYLFMNTGNAIIRSANIHWFLNNKYLDYSSEPYIIGSTHGAEINIIKTSTPGFCEINFKNLPPNVGFMVGVNHKVKQSFADSIYQDWTNHMFEQKFTAYFLSQVSISGEKTSIENDGAYDLKEMKK